MAHKHQRGWTTLQAQLCHEADPQLGHNESSARHSRQSRHSSSTEESDGAKKSTLKFMQDSWRRTTSQSWSWRWQVLQVHASTMCNGAIAFLRTGGDPPPPVPPPNVGRSIYIEISAGCNKSKANSLCQSYAVMQVVKWLASSASQRGKGARS